MDGAKGSALEWALALLRAPGERQGLRHRPLPADGMDVLLGIAAGTMPDQLAEQARRFGESEADVLEAARFYAREVLLHPQADAYRMLGVAPEASADRIKAHYRLLQHWLHPDRARSEDDALFATRVNGAWNQLRTPARRRAYDEALRQASSPSPIAGGAAPLGRGTWRPEPVQGVPVSVWRQRLPVLALCGLCLVLVLLALRDVDPPPEAWGDVSRTTRTEESALATALLGGVSRKEAKESATDRAPQAQPPAGQMPASPPMARPAAALVAKRDTLRPIAENQVASAPAEASPGADPVQGHAGSAASRRRARADAARPQNAEAGGDGAVSVADAATPMPADDDVPAFERLQAARRAGERLMDYLRKPDAAAPPIWNSPTVEARADRLRQDMHASGRVRLAEPQWRIGSDQAVLSAGLAASDAMAVPARLTATLRWRDGLWLVTALTLEAAP